MYTSGVASVTKQVVQTRAVSRSVVSDNIENFLDVFGYYPQYEYLREGSEAIISFRNIRLHASISILKKKNVNTMFTVLDEFNRGALVEFWTKQEDKDIGTTAQDLKLFCDQFAGIVTFTTAS